MTSTTSNTEGWRGRLILSPGRLLFLGPGGAAARHSHHAMQLVVGLRGEVHLELDGLRLSRRATMVRSNVPHALDASGDDIALLLLEPSLLDPRDVAVRPMTDPPHHAAELWPRLSKLGIPPLDASADAFAAWVDTMLVRVGAGPRPRLLSGHTHHALRYVDEEIERLPRLEGAAERTGLSPSRMSHLFRSEVGLPFRRFVLWARLRRAAQFAAAGASITECAIGAGFSDGAHFSRTFRAHFGLPPSVVLPRIESAPATWPTL